MSGEETELIHIDSEAEQQVGGGADKVCSPFHWPCWSRFRIVNGTSLPKCLLTKDIVREVFKETVGNEYQLSTVDILNDSSLLKWTFHAHIPWQPLSYRN